MAMNFFRPERYQGARKRRSYFEGWYFKQVSADGSAAWSFIPGIAHDRDGKSGAFVQALDGSSGKAYWFPYPASAFESAADRFEIAVGESRFSLAGATVRLGSGPDRIEADLAFESPVRFPSTIARPGIMGPFAYVPFMECYHGLVSMDHRLEGEIRQGGMKVTMDGGRGYIEKDWGRSMPSSWIWSQTNSFGTQGDSFMLSVARIPWLGRSFTGFLCVLYAGGRLLRFATYTGHELRELRADAKSAFVEIAGRGSIVRFRAGRDRAGTLAAPVAGAMNRRISEALDARVSVEYQEGGRVSWSGESVRAGLEIAGDPAELLS